MILAKLVQARDPVLLAEGDQKRSKRVAIEALRCGRRDADTLMGNEGFDGVLHGLHGWLLTFRP
jgi:hypothetical protein